MVGGELQKRAWLTLAFPGLSESEVTGELGLGEDGIMLSSAERKIQRIFHSSTGGGGGGVCMHVHVCKETLMD